MQLVYSFRIDKSDRVYRDLKSMCRVSKDLYNQALFEIKVHYGNCKQVLSYKQLDKIMKEKTNLQGRINYRLLPAQVAQQTLKLLSQNVKAFFCAYADYRQHPEKYKGAPQFPAFLPRHGYFTTIFPNQKASITQGGSIKLWKQIEIAIPCYEFVKYQRYFIEVVGDKVRPLFAQVRIVPKFNADFLNIEIVYDRPEAAAELDTERVAAIDLGVNNLVTLVDSAMAQEDRPPIIVNGRPVKSINQYYNKQRAHLQQRLAQTEQISCKRMERLSDRRTQKIKDYLHKTSHFVVRYLLQHRIGRLVIGYNPNWKQEVAMGKRNNQTFVGIPFWSLIRMLCYKCRLVGIEVSTPRESYTSKCSALDLETIAKHADHAYAGKRVKRGLFRSALGLHINADVNGAINILRNTIGDSFLTPFISQVARLIPSRGYLRYPLKIYFKC